MPDMNWYETSEDMLMPLPLNDEDVEVMVGDEMLTEEPMESVPMTPTMPSEPGMPSVPMTPSTPSRPGMTGMPSIPVTPSTPSRPVVPGTPVTPSRPSTPTPSVPVRPSRPTPSVPSRPNRPNINVIPIIPGITMIGYVRFLNASPGAPAVDIYANGRRVAANLRYRDFTEYMKVFPGRYRIAVFAAGTRRNPLSVTMLQVRANDILTVAVTGLAGNISTQTINDSRHQVPRNRANVRFVQLSPNAPRMDAYWDDALVLADLNFGDVSRYLQTTAGRHNLKMRDSRTGGVLVESPDVTLQNGRAYTIYIVGDRNDRVGLQILVPLEGATYLDFGA